MTRGVRPQGAEEVSDRERRRGIALVLDRQPEIDLDELQRILARVGIVVDTDTLVGDLDALGYDVDDDDVAADTPPTVEPLEPVAPIAPTLPADAPMSAAGAHASPVGATDGEGHDEPDAFAEGPSSTSRGPRAATDPEGPGGRDDTDDDDLPEGTWSRQSLLIAAAVVLAVILVAVFLAGSADDDAGERADAPGGEAEGVGTAQASSGGGSGEATTTGPTEPVEVAPVGPGGDPALDAPGTRTDDFERAEVGDFPDVGPWELLSGEWTNTDGNLEVTEVPEDGFAVAAVDPGSGDVRAQVQVDRRSSRSGLAFRIVDDRTFFVWATVPEYATTILFEVADGEARPVADSGLTTTGDGLPALGVNLVGTRAELLHDGVVVATYDDLPPSEDATRIGVAALTDEEGLPLFDEYAVLTP